MTVRLRMTKHKTQQWRTYCHACDRARWQPKNSLASRQKAVRRKQVIRLSIRAVLRAAKNVPCADCGGRFPPEAMDFDHLPHKGKRFSLSNVQYATMASVVAEMERCEIVCANCHRIRTAGRNRGRKPGRIAERPSNVLPLFGP